MQNNENYSGFDLTMYNLFTLLREMYYTRGETETNFLQKSGGVLSGSLTIQGNLVINGQSYSIDTENLKVGDYTITLAKDNEQTLTSMVGMVVPKYDGTNYGFFGWDADGYAYVGDLTNYDGTSAITLANNSSLQRISTIDTTNTVVASNGVIYVYDATSHCFKKPTNDNKYYVIRNGAFVETELFTEQKSKNIDNALYNIGAYDTVSGNTITRQTGYRNVSKWIIENADLLTFRSTANGYQLGKDNGSGLFPNCYTSDTLATGVVNNSDFTFGNDNTSYGNVDDYILNQNWISLPNTYTTKASYLSYFAQNEIIVQYKLATSYTENIIPNQPLLTLNQDGCNWLQNEWKKGLNLFNYNSRVVGKALVWDTGETYDNSSYWTSDYIEVKSNATYSVSGNTYNGVCYYNSNKTFISGISTAVSGSSFTTPNNTAFIRIANQVSTTQVMLNEGNHSYPYEPPYGEIVHKSDIEPVLLWENSSPTSSFTSTGSSNVISWNTEFKYLIFAMKYYNDRNGITYIKVKPISSGTNDLGLSNGANYFGRAFVHTSTTSGYFENAYANGSINSGNNVCIPVAIYGTNVL